MIICFLTRSLTDPLIKILAIPKGYLISLLENFYTDIVESTKCELY